MSDFSDRPFVAGSLVGLRAFNVDRLGRLVGPSVPQVFTPEVNEAECRKNEFAGIGGWITPGTMTFYSTTANYPPPPAPPSSFLKRMLGYDDQPEEPVEPKGLHETALAELESRKPKHNLGGMGCSCGFYAYFDGRNDYKEPSRVAAIIEGFGVCTVGTRGFRASKARLVAIVVPGKKFPEARFSLVAHNYPDVPLYASRRAAIEAHPLTTPEVPTPETCDDFWTRSAR